MTESHHMRQHLSTQTRRNNILAWDCKWSVSSVIELLIICPDQEGDPGSPAPLYVFIIISVVTTALCMLVAAAVVIYLRKLRRQTLSSNNKCLEATNR